MNTRLILQALMWLTLATLSSAQLPNVVAVKQFTGIYPASASLQIPFHGCVTLDSPLPKNGGEYWFSVDHLAKDVDYTNLQILVNFEGTILGARAVFKGTDKEWQGARGLASRNRVLSVFCLEASEKPLQKSLPLAYDGIGFGGMVFTFDTSGHVSWRFPQNSSVSNEDEYVASQEEHKRSCEECKNLNTAAIVVLP